MFAGKPMEEARPFVGAHKVWPFLAISPLQRLCGHLPLRRHHRYRARWCWSGTGHQPKGRGLDLLSFSCCSAASCLLFCPSPVVLQPAVCYFVLLLYRSQLSAICPSSAVLQPTVWYFVLLLLYCSQLPVILPFLFFCTAASCLLFCCSSFFVLQPIACHFFSLTLNNPLFEVWVTWLSLN